MNKILQFDLFDVDQRGFFSKLIAALNESGVTWGVEFDPCTCMISVEIGDGY